ncbi:MAG TPA: TonB-dependent receptor plug domain-containing protein [Rhodocyclaceae bacterium]|nr:TonB-dependent receptor plug domain-containing protein [Rhodocyclaceae bacterium]
MSNKNEAEMRESPPADRARERVRVASSVHRVAKLGFPPNFKRLSFAGLVAAAFVASHVRADDSEMDLTKLPFEQLVNTEIITASKLAKQVSEASSAVSIVTAADIKAYGYRTLDDILQSMRGLSVAQSTANGYSFLGGRGFGGVGDYAGRITLLIDSHSVNESVGGQSFFGANGFLDVELIDRVEYIPGAGSAMYGNGAFLGVINVITKKGRDFDGTQVAQEDGSHQWNKSRLTYGKQLENGLDLLISGSSYSNDGRNATRYQMAGAEERLEREQNHRLFLKASYSEWSLESGWVRRPIYAPISAEYSSDESRFISLTHDARLNQNLRLSLRGTFGEYLFNNTGTDQWGPWFDFSRGRWGGIDAKFVGTWFDNHTLVLGVEHRDDYQLRMVFANPLTDTNRRTESFYVYDDYELRSNVQLNYGLRYERRDNGSEIISPRAAVIFKPWSATVLKFSSGVANRQPTPFEEYVAYIYAGVNSVRTERVQLNEFVWEQRLAPATRLMASLYRYRTDGRTILFDSSYVSQKVFAQGADVEVEHSWDGGSRLKASYAWQDSWNKQGVWMTNSPHHLAKFNFTTPVWGEKLRVGLETQAVSRRLEPTDPQVRFGGYSVTNLTLTSSHAIQGWQASFSVRNVFNRSYSDVVTSDGRNVWLQLSRDFK